MKNIESIISELLEYIKEIEDKNARLHSIIKEVRECIKKNRVYITGERNLAFEIEEILDKGDK